jgi:hypothetical protein
VALFTITTEFHIIQFRMLGVLMNAKSERIWEEEIAMQFFNVQELTRKNSQES